MKPFLRLGFVCACAALVAACASTYDGPKRPHFDGKIFSNPGVVKESSVLGYLWLRITTSQTKWPDAVPLTASPAPPPRVTGDEARVTLIGHATMLIQVSGLNILTDPVWSERASFVSWAGPKRVTPPSLSIDALPPIDVVLISHNHYDHLDTATLVQLHARSKPRVIVPLGNAKLVQSVMPQSVVTEHDWGDAVTVSSAKIHIEPMLHGSGRSPFDQMQTLWAAYVIEAASIKIYHVGDAGYGTGAQYKAAGEKHGGIDLALLPIGAYEPAAFMADSHMRPSDAVRAMLDSNSRRAMAHHFETFQLGFEGFDAPRKEADETVKKLGIQVDRFTLPKPGDFILVQPAQK